MIRQTGVMDVREGVCKRFAKARWGRAMSESETEVTGQMSEGRMSMEVWVEGEGWSRRASRGMMMSFGGEWKEGWKRFVSESVEREGEREEGWEEKGRK